MKKFSIIAAVILGLAFGMSAYAGHGTLNINTSSAQDLVWLPGIDSSVANSIVQFRNSNGPFNSVDDLLKVKGVNRVMIDEIRNLVTLKGNSSLDVTEMRSLDGHEVSKSNDK